MPLTAKQTRLLATLGWGTESLTALGGAAYAAARARMPLESLAGQQGDSAQFRKSNRERRPHGGGKTALLNRFVRSDFSFLSSARIGAVRYVAVFSLLAVSRAYFRAISRTVRSAD